MDESTIAMLQVVTVGIGALTAVINFVALFVRRKVDPSELQLISIQSKQMAASNRRTARSLDTVNTRISERIVGIDGKLSAIQSAVEKIST